MTTATASGNERQEFESALAVKIHFFDGSLLAGQNVSAWNEVPVELIHCTVKKEVELLNTYASRFTVNLRLKPRVV